MSKYIVEIEEKPLCVFDKDTQTYFPRLWRVKGFNSLVFDEEGLSRLEELNSDYISENFGSLQDEAYQRGLEDGKKSVSEPDRIEVGDEVTFLPNDRRGIVTACHVPDVYAENDKYAVFCGTTVEYVLRQHITKTGKRYDIQSILEAMRK